MDRLSSLRKGEWCVIEGFSDPSVGTTEPLDESQGLGPSGAAQSGSSLIATLMKLGFVPGAQLRLAARGLGGDPLAVDVRGGRVALGRSEADWVIVKRTGTP